MELREEKKKDIDRQKQMGSHFLMPVFLCTSLVSDIPATVGIQGPSNDRA